MNLQKLILTKNPCYKKADKITPCGVLWHSTGANNPNLKRYVGPDDGKLGVNQYGNHWNRPDATLCGHAMIGKLKDDTIATYQTLLYDMRCWLSGSGSKGNANTLGYIQFEICEDNTKNKDYAMAAYREAVEFSAYILKQFKLDPLAKNRHGLPVVLDHANGHKLGIASNHGDVLHWFGKYGITMDKIRQDIAVEMGQIKPDPEPNPVSYDVKVNTKNGLNVRKTPNGTFIKTLPNGAQLTISKEQKDSTRTWGYTAAHKGWVALDFTTKVTPPAPKPDPPKPTPTPTPTVPTAAVNWMNRNKLKQGDWGTLVDVAQVALVMRGHDVGGLDGAFGPATDKAVRALQKAHKIAVDGWIGKDTWSILLGNK